MKKFVKFKAIIISCLFLIFSCTSVFAASQDSSLKTFASIISRGTPTNIALNENGELFFCDENGWKKSDINNVKEVSSYDGLSISGCNYGMLFFLKNDGSLYSILRYRNDNSGSSDINLENSIKIATNIKKIEKAPLSNNYNCVLIFETMDQVRKEVRFNRYNKTFDLKDIASQYSAPYSTKANVKKSVDRLKLLEDNSVSIYNPKLYGEYITNLSNVKDIFYLYYKDLYVIWFNNGQVATCTTEDINFSKIPVNINLNYSLNNIIKLDAGDDHAIALDSNGKLYCIGDTSAGQLGNNEGTIDDESEMKSDGFLKTRVIGTGNTPYHETFKQINCNNDKPIVNVYASSCGSVAIQDDGTLILWGWQIDGKYGPGMSLVPRKELSNFKVSTIIPTF
ncbi:hypothetical protein [Tepidibacter hydrothermalis]|uniref:Regulator of chromosome condensation RCC1 n=1 Tax=Tepidibacter hydrothermalis TaxID=3036126 RepID=A0ABY8EHK9_9FIRM|nr:hypothetical protein [Tepidibacter hydrothermalis]WFD12440.1 hypothetical protein P4S50_19875 [Tepidibacter hydrothermalis]